MTDDPSIHAMALAKSRLEEQDARIAELEAALRDVLGWVPGRSAWHTDAPIEAVERARSVLNKETSRG